MVGGITGIRVWETLPDTFFDRADEVMLVDIPADELLGRLKAGKVYIPEQAERASKNFFRKGNLIALRELALRRTADRVEEDVQSYRTKQAIERVWKTEASFLCCIGPRPGGEHVVRSAARLATQLNVDWTAVYVETPALQRLPSGRRERILRTLKLAQDLGANTAILSGSDAPSAIVEYARSHNISKLIFGRSPRQSLLSLEDFIRDAPGIAGSRRRLRRDRPRGQRRPGPGAAGRRRCLRAAWMRRAAQGICAISGPLLHACCRR